MYYFCYFLHRILLYFLCFNLLVSTTVAFFQLRTYMIIVVGWYLLLSCDRIWKRNYWSLLFVIYCCFHCCQNLHPMQCCLTTVYLCSNITILLSNFALQQTGKLQIFDLVSAKLLESIDAHDEAVTTMCLSSEKVRILLWVYTVNNFFVLFYA